MAKQKFGLGRGLDALISGASDVISANQPSRVNEQNILKVALAQIVPNPRQPRKIFREDDPRLLELSASIKEYGLLQPLVVTRLDQLPGAHAVRFRASPHAAAATSRAPRIAAAAKALRWHSRHLRKSCQVAVRSGWMRPKSRP